MKIQIIPTGPNSADVRCGEWKVPITWKKPEYKPQLIEMARWALQKKLGNPQTELLTKKN